MLLYTSIMPPVRITFDPDARDYLFNAQQEYRLYKDALKTELVSSSGDPIGYIGDDLVPDIYSLSIQKTADLSAVSAFPLAGEVITYTFSVQNTNEATLTNIEVSDPLIDAVSPVGTIASLAPSATAAITANYAITQSDIDTGNITNTASAVSDNVKEPVEVTITTVIAQNYSLSLAKTADDSAVSSPPQVGDIITYTFQVENTGNVTLSNVVISDPLIDEVNPVGTIASLAPGVTDNSTTATYAITQADIDAAGVTNTASAVSDNVTTPVESTQTVPLASEWILAFGVWNDDGIWVDDAAWDDG